MKLTFIIGLIIGLNAGTVIGVVVMCFAIIAKTNDKLTNKYESEKNRYE